MTHIDAFEMERYQTLYWHLVDYDLSESGVTPLTIRELLGPDADPEFFLQQALGYPLSERVVRDPREHRPVVPGMRAGERHAHERRIRGQPALALVPPGTPRPARLHAPQLLPGSRARSVLRRWRRHLQAEAPRRAVVTGRRGPRPGRR